jgi:hypothetical protein
MMRTSTAGRRVPSGMRVTLWLLGVLWLGGAAAVVGQPASRVIEDFGRDDGVSPLGTRWMGFTDRVMGGVSDQQVTLEEIDGRRALRLRGQVRLENNGGFIQVALPLAGAREAMDASGFGGVRLLVRGNGEQYAVHLRTTAARLPWQYYEATFTAGPAWTTVDLPFERFAPQALSRPIDPASLTRVAVVGAKRAFTADVAVARIELYANGR